MAGDSGAVGVILAGGRSSRMGENKAAMLLAGEPLLLRALRRLSTAVDDQLVIGPDALRSLVPGVRVIPDLVSSIGPLGGLYTALRSTACDRIFLMACDMPFVQPGLVRAMLAASAANDSAEAVIVSGQDSRQWIQPLHAVYKRACLPKVEQALTSEDRSLRALLSRINVLTLDAAVVRHEDPRGLSSINVNTPADWQRALRLAADLEPSDGG